jgi:hypothetical protein
MEDEKKLNKTQAIILLLVLIAIGGIVLYGKDTPSITKKVPPLIEGPTTPPPGYAAPR